MTATAASVLYKIVEAITVKLRPLIVVKFPGSELEVGGGPTASAACRHCFMNRVRGKSLISASVTHLIFHTREGRADRSLSKPRRYLYKIFSKKWYKPHFLAAVAKNSLSNFWQSLSQLSQFLRCKNQTRPGAQ